ncbi:deoxyribodipyrimidine photo-lyase [Aureibaculum sp. 2210JD6-5]|uniref:cryptochrome/photolyase family protein n=1 Tax=Aureibaculum sp. 2210JD6-5 TaxID=3103957 RepID=UPI002AADC8AB|nr:deoxyribodipyrimidine photo-lyase [Aureibaculum sp. 2210JD6-5]MDY7394254.1 deoxyribodipyrimidine photo-lyase [Aureibaculum sp. 2210JD6-5]
MKKNEITIFWFRRDLRLEDNVGLNAALKSGLPVLPIFIFDNDILEDLPKNDARVSFIYKSLKDIHLQLKKKNSSLLIKKGKIADIWKELITEFNVKNVFYNRDYEPYALKRDQEITDLLSSNDIEVSNFKDQVIFEKDEVLKGDGDPYTVYTPYKNKWLEKFKNDNLDSVKNEILNWNQFCQYETLFPTLETIGFVKSKQKVHSPNLNIISDYDKNRDFPAKNGTSYLSPHLRFGTISIRKLVVMANEKNAVFLSELIWREFFMQILFHFPKVVTNNFRSKYDGIKWRDNKADFKRWCEGTTGYPLVDAGMRELNETGYMHNRVRMVTASFLCKHLLIDWKWGEAYFAEKLLDYELSSNNGNWQWAAGTGCDAAPYFRIFNPTTQLKKFDKNLEYTRKWIPEFDSGYPEPMVEHKFARERALKGYKVGLQ